MFVCLFVCRLGVDNHTLLSFNTPSEGYWREGRFQGDNIWASGGKDAPFDRPVSCEPDEKCFTLIKVLNCFTLIKKEIWTIVLNDRIDQCDDTILTTVSYPHS